ncbi:Ig-like domain-containing protein [Rudaea sp.]|uniref:Ig-like domain-containing protein n=1 Tax=Rudaea sp. TaxID=2136325 RepID=UPI002ED4A536
MIAFQRLPIRLFALLAAIPGLLAAWPVAAATTYSYTSPNYTAAQITGTGTAPVYTTAMHFSGSFTTVNPLPANMPSTNIGATGSNLVQSWSFTDGLHTYSASNTYLDTDFTVATDAAGNIQTFYLGGLSPLPPNTVGQKMNGLVFEIVSSNAIVQAASNAPCTTVSSGGVCTNATGASGDSFVQMSQAGAIVVGSAAGPTTTALTRSSGPNPSVYGTSLVFVANVQGSAPSGQVTFYDGAAVLCANVNLVANSTSSSTASCATSTLAVGTHSLTAVYSGDPQNAGSSSSALAQTVTASTPPPPAVAVSAPTLTGLGLLALVLGFVGMAAYRRRAQRAP